MIDIQGSRGKQSLMANIRRKRRKGKSKSSEKRRRRLEEAIREEERKKRGVHELNRMEMKGRNSRRAE